MRPALLLGLVAFGILAWLLFDLGGRAVDTPSEAPVEPVERLSTTTSTTTAPEPTTTTTAAPTTTTTKPFVRAASASRPVVVTAGTVNGYPCGGELPPCWVLKRESGGDPRIWNGRCYMPAGSTGQCGRSSASGLWQFLRSTWAGFGGYLNAADAPPELQNEKARLLWAGGRGCRHWAAC